MRTFKKSFLRFLILFLTVCAVSLGARGETNPLDAGPTSLLLLYRCAPANRIALRSYMLRTGLPRFHQWRQRGVIANEKVLFSRYVNTDNWDMLVFLQFQTYSEVARWNKVERTLPAGLDKEALRLTTGILTYPLDQVAAKALDTSANDSVYLFIPYDYTVSTDAYLRYLHGYVLPQLSGWMDANVLQSYRMFLGRGAAGRPYSAVLLLQYKDDAALGARDRIVAQVRESLKKDPAWKALSENKQSVRTEKAAIIADELK